LQVRAAAAIMQCAIGRSGPHARRVATAALLAWRGVARAARPRPPVVAAATVADAVSTALAAARRDAASRTREAATAAAAAATARTLAVVRVAITAVSGVGARSAAAAAADPAAAPEGDALQRMRALVGAATDALRAAFGHTPAVALFPHAPSQRLQGPQPPRSSGGDGRRADAVDGSAAAAPPVLWTFDERGEPLFVPLNASLVATAVDAATRGGGRGVGTCGDDAIVGAEDSMRDPRVGSCDRAVLSAAAAAAGRAPHGSADAVAAGDDGDGDGGGGVGDSSVGGGQPPAPVASLTVCARDASNGEVLVVLQVRP
jgi:hypothetical protein